MASSETEYELNVAFRFCCCLCVPVYGLAGTEQKSNEFLFLLGEFNQLRDKVHTLETSLRKDVNVELNLSEQRCENGEHHFKGVFDKQTIRFSKPFTRTPVINYGFVELDSSAKTNLRAFCRISDITKEKFDLKCGKWDNTMIYGVRISWMAC